MWFCLASASAFGAMGVLGKLAYDDGATVGTLLSARFLLAALLFWMLVPAGELRTLRRRDVAIGLGLGAVVYALQAGMYFTALARIDASLLSLLVYTFPAIVAVAAVLLGRERFDGRKAVALCLASGGLVLVVASAGTGAPAPPAHGPRWTVSASGAGEQTIDVPVRDGGQRLVIMNADAGAGVDVTAALSVRAPFLRRLGLGLLIAGALVAPVGGLLLAAGVRRVLRDRPPAVASG